MLDLNFQLIQANARLARTRRSSIEATAAALAVPEADGTSTWSPGVFCGRAVQSRGSSSDSSDSGIHECTHSDGETPQQKRRRATRRSQGRHMEKLHVEALSIPPQWVTFATDELKREIGCDGGAHVCILGSTAFRYRPGDAEALVQALARDLEQASTISSSVFLTCGLHGAQETFARFCGDGSRVWNVLPVSTAGAYGVGRDVYAGSTLEERRLVFRAFGDVYVTIEGGPSVAQEAKIAASRGAYVLPFRRTGGASAGMFDFPSDALKIPGFVTKADWALLGDISASVEETAAAGVRIIVSLIEDVQGQRKPAKSSFSETSASPLHARRSTNKELRFEEASDSSTSSSVCSESTGGDDSRTAALLWKRVGTHAKIKSRSSTLSGPRNFYTVSLGVFAAETLIDMVRSNERRLSASQRFSMFTAAMADVADPAEARHPTRARSGKALLGDLQGTHKESFLREQCLQEGAKTPIPKDKESLNVIEELFFDSMPKEFVLIETVEQVINPRLLRRFLKCVQAEPGSVEATFHGTPAKFAECILRDGLLKDLNTTAAYGRGAYVGAHAGVAHQYADPDANGLRCMCVVLASTGKQIRKGEMGKEQRVTAVDRLVNPTQYCFVDEARLLVSHLITYRVTGGIRRRVGGGWHDPFEKKLNDAITKAARDLQRGGIL